MKNQGAAAALRRGPANYMDHAMVPEAYGPIDTDTDPTLIDLAAVRWR